MEMWDVYDKDRNKTNQTIRAKSKLAKDQYRLIIHVCIFNSENQMLIQKRHPNKEIYPNMWDVTVGGGVMANENSHTAAEREVLEELNYKLSLQDKRVSLTFNYAEGFDDFFLIKKDINIQDLTLQAAEVIDAKWASEAEILLMLENKRFLPYHKSLIKLLFFMKDDMKIHTY